MDILFSAIGYFFNTCKSYANSLFFLIILNQIKLPCKDRLRTKII